MTGDGLISVNVVGEKYLTKVPKHDINYITDWVDWRQAQEDKTRRYGLLDTRRTKKEKRSEAAKAWKRTR